GAPPSRLAEARAMPAETLQARIQSLADDIQQMRPFLVHHFRPHKTIVELTPDYVVVWSFRLGVGIASLVVGRSAADVRRKIKAVRSLMTIRVGHDGLLFDKRMPWHTPIRLDASTQPEALALNYLILERFHPILFSFYDRIDFARLRTRPTAAVSGPEGTPADEETAIAVACQALAEMPEVPVEADAEPPSFGRIPVLRLPQLLRVFE